MQSDGCCKTRQGGASPCGAYPAWQVACIGASCAAGQQSHPPGCAAKLMRRPSTGTACLPRLRPAASKATGRLWRTAGALRCPRWPPPPARAAMRWVSVASVAGRQSAAAYSLESASVLSWCALIGVALQVPQSPAVWTSGVLRVACASAGQRGASCLLHVHPTALHVQACPPARAPRLSHCLAGDTVIAVLRTANPASGQWECVTYNDGGSPWELFG